MKELEMAEARSTSVSCSGKDTPLDHPTVYLEIDSKNGFIVCPYCSKKFVLVK